MIHRALHLLALSVLGWGAALYAAEGATVPWTTWEAETMTTSGATVLGPPGMANNKNVLDPLVQSVEMESSGRRCVKLNGAGAFVEFTATVTANAIVVRYCLPDSADGVGLDSTITVTVNGGQVTSLPVTSRYSWRYGSYTFTNNPGDGKPRNFYDEVRFKGLTIAPGNTVRIAHPSTATASYCIIDLVDLENVGAALGPPANALNVTSAPYNANPNGTVDATAAIQNCINDARSQGRNVFIPAGSFKVAGDFNNIQDITIQGAGMWYTTIVGDPSQYNAGASRQIRFNGGGSNIHISDFSIIGRLNHRNDGDANDGFSEFFGTGSSIARIWVEHTKTGAWIANSSGLVVDGCRFRNTIADGINLCLGVRSSVIQNCTARGCGDDAFAIWPATYAAQTYAPGLNVIRNCTASLCSLGNGVGVYGGEGNTVQDCTFSDMPFGCGILVSGTFPIVGNGRDNSYAGTTTVQRCTVTRCGGWDSGWNAYRAAVTICPQNNNIPNLALAHLTINDSLSYAFEIVNPGGGRTLTNAAMSSIAITTYGLLVPVASAAPYVDGVYGVWARSDARGDMAVTNLTVNGTAITAVPASGHLLKDEAGNFTFTFTSGTPVITSALTKTGTVGQALTYQITAANTPTAFNATGLPAGLSVNTTTGAITGTPSAAGTTQVTLAATNGTGTGTATLVMTISAAGAAPVITSPLTAGGTVGQAFSYQIAASNTPTGFNATGLPAGLSVNTTTGAITGTPTAAGTGTATLSATNATGTGTAALVITVGSGGGTALAINAGGDAVGTFGSDQHFTGGTVATSTNTIDVTAAHAAPEAVYQSERWGACTYAIPGLTAGAACTVRLHFAETWCDNSGDRIFSVTINGAAALTDFDIIQAAGAKNKAVVRDFAATATAGGVITIALIPGSRDNPTVNGIEILAAAGVAPVITSPLTAAGTVGQAFTYQIAASNTPTSFNATGLPAGLSVNTTTGAITGTPTVAGTGTATLSATNGAGTGTAALVITVATAGSRPVITSPLTATGTVGQAFSYQIAATNAPTRFNATGLPAGLGVNTTTGAITGTPTVAGTGTATLSATNGAGTGTAALVITVATAGSRPVITSPLTAAGTVGQAFSYQIAATNAPTAFQAGGLPAGLTVHVATGMITGTPTAVGTRNATISATNAHGTGSATLVVTIASGRPVIASPLTATGTVGQAFTYRIIATNTPTSYKAIGLPAGLAVDPGTGAIIGTPTAAGRQDVTISATNAQGTDAATLTITIHGDASIASPPASEDEGGGCGVGGVMALLGAFALTALQGMGAARHNRRRR